MSKGPVSQFIQHHYRHFNAAALVDAAKGYEQHLLEGGKMMVTLAGAMSTAELGVSLAEMIRQDKVQIIFEDTGNGISPEHLEHIFEPFTTNNTRGMGLGLSIVHNIVSNHRGQIEVKSEVGAGTRVLVELPGCLKPGNGS